MGVKDWGLEGLGMGVEEMGDMGISGKPLPVVKAQTWTAMCT